MEKSPIEKLEEKIDKLSESVNKTNIELAGFKGKVWGVVVGLSGFVGFVTSVLTLYFARK